MPGIDDESELHKAAERGHFLVVELIVKKGCNVDAVGKDGKTALHKAVEKGHFRTVDMLVRKGCNVDAVDKDDKTALHKAVERGHLEFVDLLVKKGCNVDAVDKDGKTALHKALQNNYHLETIKLLVGRTQKMPSVVGESALHKAAKRGHLELVDLLVKKGCNVDAADKDGKTALHKAAERGHLELVDLLVEKGCNVDAADKDGKTVLHLSVENCHFGIIEYLFEKSHFSVIELLVKKGCNKDAADKDGKTALHKAAERGHLELVDLLVKKGCNVDAADKDGKTALHKADEGGHLELVDLLVKKGCNVDAADKDGKTALHKAAERGHLEFVDLLVKKGCNVDAVDKDGKTALHKALQNNYHLETIKLLVGRTQKMPSVVGESALHKAAKRGHLELVDLLVKKGCNVDAADKDGKTALHKAAERGHLELVDLLVEKGCNVDAADKDGKTVLHLSVENCHFGIIEYLFEKSHFSVIELLVKKGCNKDAADKDGKTALHKAAERGHLELVDLLVKKGCNVDAADKDGKTALHKADEGGHLELVDLLVKKGCNVDAADKDGKTALHKAAERGHLEFVDLLVKKGCNVDAVDKDGKTALHKALQNNYHLETIKLLVGRTQKMPSVVGESALHKAAEGGHLELVDLLVKKGCNVDAADKDGKTALHKAAERGHLSVVELLMRLGCKKDVCDQYGQTALMKAARGNSTEIVIFLLSSGCCIDIADHDNRTALHHSVSSKDHNIPMALLEAGADLDAKDKEGKSFSDIARRSVLHKVKEQLLSLENRKIVCVIGHQQVGKSTLVKAFSESGRNLWFKSFRNVGTVEKRTAGIDTKTICDERCGNLIFFDFAGHSEYYSSHYAFLEAALSSRGTIITFFMVVDLRIPYEKRVQQCTEWLSPIQSISCTRNTIVSINVILVGSHRDHFYFWNRNSVDAYHQNSFEELKTEFRGVTFKGCCTMDCRKLASIGLEKLKSYFEGGRVAIDENVTSKVPLRACLFWKRMQKTNCLQIGSILQRGSFPYTIPLIHTCCQDLSSAGLAIYLQNKDKLEDGWLIVEMEKVITDIHGKLFAPESDEFPMHHRDLANKFGLVLSSDLELAFTSSPFDSEMIRCLLISMEFSHPVDKELLGDEITSLLSPAEDGVEWLYFPSLVRVEAPTNVFSYQKNDCNWLCWEMRGASPHVFSARFQHSVFLKMAAKFAEKLPHATQKSVVERHSCTMWKNGISWRVTNGMDMKIEIIGKCTIQVLACCRPHATSCLEYFSKVIQELFSSKQQHLPNLKITTVLKPVVNGEPTAQYFPMEGIIKSKREGHHYIRGFSEGKENIISDTSVLIPFERIFSNISVTIDQLQNLSGLVVDIPNLTPESSITSKYLLYLCSCEPNFC